MRAPAAERSILRRSELISSWPAHTFHPDFDGAIRYTSQARPDDDELATAQTIAEMGRLIREDSRSSTIRDLAHSITAGARNGEESINRVFWWVKLNVSFRKDDATAKAANIPEAALAEVLIRPLDLLAMRRPAGDCDDFSMLTAALLRAIGIQADLVTIAAAEPDLYSHVYVQACTEGKTIALDTSHGQHPGWAAKPTGKYRVWSIDAMQSSRLNGLGETFELPDYYPGLDTSGSSFKWSPYLETAFDTFSEIAKARWGQVNLNPGTYIQSGGNVMFRQQPGSSPLQFPTASLGSSSGGWLLLLAAVAVVFIIARSR